MLSHPGPDKNHVNVMHWLYWKSRINVVKWSWFLQQNNSLSNLVILGNFLHYRAWSLCNQLLLQFSMDHFETMQTCCGYIEDVHVNFCRRNNNFWQSYGILDLDNIQARLQYGVASLCNQLLPEFSSNQFETLHRCYKHIEDVHVTFAGKKIIFDKIMAFWT